MLKEMNEVANDIRTFLEVAGHVSVGPAKSVSINGKPVVEFKFASGVVEVHNTNDIHVVDESDKEFSDFFETRRYLASKYLKL